MTDSLKIRTGTPADIATVMTFWAEAAEGTDRHDTTEAVTALVERDPEALLIAESDGIVVGTLIAGWDGWRASLYRMAVHPAHRRRGIASSLLAVAEDRFRGFGAFRVDAMVLDANLDAHRLWAAAGYTAQDDSSRWVRKMEKGQPLEGSP
ncbi:GNAT family N-acetyltransferase [Nonomuraea sp. NBC_01738]|uniref:GNAT family N-acetyltransferase n=1 Tax=Nonomuraea sp. NBC_01738 TaxID=2976003 RepID=UPI002E0FB6BA|nr:GNAT family N-acetyltransferase [Nonomuraea sp. NBC_01738]